MGKITLCIAASLDGYIADMDGNVDFLFEAPRVDPDPDYREFYENVEAILFGSVTYRQITTEVSPEKWLYPGKKSFVFTTAQTGKTEHAEFTSLSPTQFKREVCDAIKGDIWLFGGKKLIESFMRDNLIDEYWLYFVPVILGGGVPLFTPDGVKRPLKLKSFSRVDGMVKAFYTRERG